MSLSYNEGSTNKKLLTYHMACKIEWFIDEIETKFPLITSKITVILFVVFNGKKSIHWKK